VTEHDDELYLVHIDETAALIERSAAARGKQAVMSDEDLRDATIYRLQTLAESTQRLSPEFKGAHPEVPWVEVGARGGGGNRTRARRSSALAAQGYNSRSRWVFVSPWVPIRDR
jgi:hypothetical protein